MGRGSDLIDTLNRAGLVPPPPRVHDVHEKCIAGERVGLCNRGNRARPRPGSGARSRPRLLVSTSLLVFIYSAHTNALPENKNCCISSYTPFVPDVAPSLWWSRCAFSSRLFSLPA